MRAESIASALVFLCIVDGCYTDDDKRYVSSSGGVGTGGEEAPGGDGKGGSIRTGGAGMGGAGGGMGEDGGVGGDAVGGAAGNEAGQPSSSGRTSSWPTGGGLSGGAGDTVVPTGGASEGGAGGVTSTLGGAPPGGAGGMVPGGGSAGAGDSPSLAGCAGSENQGGGAGAEPRPDCDEDPVTIDEDPLETAGAASGVSQPPYPTCLRDGADGSLQMSWRNWPGGWVGCEFVSHLDLGQFDLENGGQGKLVVELCSIGQATPGPLTLWYGKYPRRKGLTLIAKGTVLGADECTTLAFAPGQAVRDIAWPPGQEEDFEDAKLALVSEDVASNFTATIDLVSATFVTAGCVCDGDAMCPAEMPACDPNLGVCRPSCASAPWLGDDCQALWDGQTCLGEWICANNRRACAIDEARCQ